MNVTPLHQTPLEEEHRKLGAHFTDFGGWHMPLKYGSELAEHRAVREAAGLFDLSHMGEIWVRGQQAGPFLDYALVGYCSAMTVGRAKYSLLCSADGGILDDLICYRTANDTFLVVPNAANTATVFAALTTRAQGFEVALEDATEHTALLAVQGPDSAKMLAQVFPALEGLDALKYYSILDASDGSSELLIARTGYTGEDGFELYLGQREYAVELWNALLTHGALPCGLASRDSLRLEAAMPLYGHELGPQFQPYQAGLGPVVALKKPQDFIGRTSLMRLHEAYSAATADPSRTVLVGLRGKGRRAARAGYPLLSATGHRIGQVTSGQPSPTLGYPIALAYVEASYASPGTEIAVDLRGKSEPFAVVSLPFYQRTR